nr:MAG TPA: hypothetical protein [Caudoviricetes sp.]
MLFRSFASYAKRKKKRTRIREPQFKKLRKPSISGAFLYVHFLHIRHLVYSETPLSCSKKVYVR